MPKEFCSLQRSLAEGVVKAVQESSRAKNDYDATKNAKKETTSQSVLLAEARKKERDAVRALDTHRKDHGCKPE